jgi:hypothetical protein
MLPSLDLLQAAAIPSGPSWQSIALIAVGALEGLGLLWFRTAAAELKQQRDDLAALRSDVVEVATHVGTNGNGLFKRLDDLSEELRGLRKEMHGLAVQMAGHRTETHP